MDLQAGIWTTPALYCSRSPLHRPGVPLGAQTVCRGSGGASAQEQQAVDRRLFPGGPLCGGLLLGALGEPLLWRDIIDSRLRGDEWGLREVKILATADCISIFVFCHIVSSSTKVEKKSQDYFGKGEQSMHTHVRIWGLNVRNVQENKYSNTETWKCY